MNYKWNQLAKKRIKIKEIKKKSYFYKQCYFLMLALNNNKILFVEQQKKCLKYLVQISGAQKNHSVIAYHLDTFKRHCPGQDNTKYYEFLVQ